MRLNAYLAKTGTKSRRSADEIIKSGRVTVNGKVGQLNDNVSEADEVKVDSRQIRMRKSRYILLYKPAGYITTLSDPKQRAIVTDLLKIDERVVPVGRLDKDTTGALLLTNNGELAHRLMHPGFNVDKVYEAQIRGEITDKKIKKLGDGIILDDSKTAPAKVRQLNDDKIEIIIHEGRNHQVKRMLAAVGLQTLSLHRRQYGPLTLKGLEPGQWRDLTENELKLLK